MQLYGKKMQFIIHFSRRIHELYQRNNLLYYSNNRDIKINIKINALSQVYVYYLNHISLFRIRFAYFFKYLSAVFMSIVITFKHVCV